MKPLAVVVTLIQPKPDLLPITELEFFFLNQRSTSRMKDLHLIHLETPVQLEGKDPRRNGDPFPFPIGLNPYLVPLDFFSCETLSGM